MLGAMKKEPSWIPGVAHFQLGHPVRGVVWIVCTLWLYLFFLVPGMLCHLACIADARRLQNV